MFEKILVPVDFTTKNSAALKAASEIASKTGGRITLLHVIERVDYLPADELKSFYSRLEKNARIQMEKFSAKVNDYKNVRKEIVYGKRAQEIVRYEIKGKYDLIILSSHRITPEDYGSGTGTVSYRVALMAQCPVLLVK